jgi:hypothetical protein
MYKSYSFDFAHWPALDLAHCKSTLQGASSTVAPVGGDKSCASKVGGCFLPVLWFSDQSWREADYEVRTESKYIDMAGLRVEYVEYGSPTVSARGPGCWGPGGLSAAG